MKHKMKRFFLKDKYLTHDNLHLKFFSPVIRRKFGIQF